MIGMVSMDSRSITALGCSLSEVSNRTRISPHTGVPVSRSPRRPGGAPFTERRARPRGPQARRDALSLEDAIET